MKLDDPVLALPFVGNVYGQRLQKLDIYSINDLLHHIPSRYEDLSVCKKISQVHPGETVTILASVASIKNLYTRVGKKIQIALVEDETGTIPAIWFNQPFLVRTITAGVKLNVSGKVDFYGHKIAFISPQFEKIIPGASPIHTGKIVPIYPETYGVSSKWLRRQISLAYQKTESEIEEYLPETIRKQEGLMTLKKSIEKIHFPQNLEEVDQAKRRLAFDEILLLELRSQARKMARRKTKLAYKINVKNDLINEFINGLPFKLTSSQEKASFEIIKDLAKDYPMNRLLDGDVGSGKTLVAALAGLATFLAGYQTVFMAPTQILASQHASTLEKLFAPFKMRISLVTSEIKNYKPGRSDIFVGTHALIHQKVDFDKVALVVIDEQQRFGVEQRSHLVKSVQGEPVAPHVLTMTATPIPRSVALTFYGDLDLSTLTESPQGRQKVTTWIVPSLKRDKAMSWIAKKLRETKSQAYVVCPLIEESQLETLSSIKAVKIEYHLLKKLFPGFKIGLLHGKLKSLQKEKVIEDFRSGKIDILVATPVVEVGMDIANATIMVIEAADRFGLAELHQLRGRVGRGPKKSYCLIFSETRSEKSAKRLIALTKSLSGSQLAQLDLELRGPGEIFGLRQHGIPNLKIASWRDIDLIRQAKAVASKLHQVAITGKIVLN
ncbi:MAG: ATP-dependent DNA helicase RecG [Patescibacteria group bacterium]